MEVLQAAGISAEHPKLVAIKDAGEVAPVTTPVMAVVAYTGSGINCWQLARPKNCAQAGEERIAGACGKPALHEGGVQEAVIDPAPGLAVVTEHD